MTDGDLDLDCELAALVDLDARQQAVEQALERFRERLKATQLAEVRRLGGELAAIGGVCFEDLVGEVARAFREAADHLEQG